MVSEHACFSVRWLPSDGSAAEYERQAEGAKLDAAIAANLKELGYGG